MRTDKEILEAVQKHHDSVSNYMERRGASVLMTSLVGSQNYGLANETRDIDTYSFVLPSITEMSELRDPIATEYDLKDGKCCIKDMRAALNLLIKTNPNSIEWFCSDYMVFNPQYEDMLKKFTNKKNRKSFLYCDIIQMGNSCKGMSKQLKNRNMPVGKKYSHALRIREMWESYLFGNTDIILKFKNEFTRLEAAEAKRCTDETKNEEYQRKSDEIAAAIKYSVEALQKWDKLSSALEKQKENRRFIYNLQFLLFQKHLMLQTAKVFG